MAGTVGAAVLIQRPRQLDTLKMPLNRGHIRCSAAAPAEDRATIRDLIM